MDRKYFMSTALGYKDITNKIINDGYQYIDENRLMNPKPMAFDYKDLNWLKENLHDFVKKSYSQISEETLDQLKNITVEEIKSRPYIFTGFFSGLDEDVYLLKIRDTNNKIYNIYIIKFEIWSEDENVINYGIIKKVRFENEEWYRSFFSSKEEYNKNKYSENTTESIEQKSSNRKYSTLLDEDENEVYKTYEGKNYLQ